MAMTTPSSKAVVLQGLKYRHVGKSGFKVSNLCLGESTKPQQQQSTPDSWFPSQDPSKCSAPVSSLRLPKRSWWPPTSTGSITLTSATPAIRTGPSGSLVGSSGKRAGPGGPSQSPPGFSGTGETDKFVWISIYIVRQPKEDKYDGVFVVFPRNEHGSLSRKEIVESVNQSLRNLNLDYIDLLIIHKFDPNCPLEGIKYNGVVDHPEEVVVFVIV